MSKVAIDGKEVDARMEYELLRGLIARFRGEIEKRIGDYSANPHSEPVRAAAE